MSTEKTDPLRVTSIRLSSETIDLLDTLAREQGGAETGRSRNVLCREAIEQYLQREAIDQYLQKEEKKRGRRRK